MLNSPSLQVRTFLELSDFFFYVFIVVLEMESGAPLCGASHHTPTVSVKKSNNAVFCDNCLRAAASLTVLCLCHLCAQITGFAQFRVRQGCETKHSACPSWSLFLYCTVRSVQTAGAQCRRLSTCYARRVPEFESPGPRGESWHGWMCLPSQHWGVGR